MSRLLEIRSRQLVQTQIAGLYTSAFRGSGLDFAGHRPYAPGDDVRHIDWNVTARVQVPHVRIFQEERERIVLIVLDVSASMEFGSRWRTKSELAREVSAVLALVAALGNDRVGLLLTGEGSARLLPPAKGRRQARTLLRCLLAPASAAQLVHAEWSTLLAGLPSRSVVFLVSDFIPCPGRRELSAVAHRHDLVPIWIMDPLERALPRTGLVPVADSESTRASWLPLSADRRRRINEDLQAHETSVREQFRRLRIDYARILTDSNFIDPLRRLMQRRLTRQER